MIFSFERAAADEKLYRPTNRPIRNTSTHRIELLLPSFQPFYENDVIDNVLPQISNELCTINSFPNIVCSTDIKSVVVATMWSVVTLS